MTLDYLHFENALRFKHVELCGVRSTASFLLCTLVITVQRRPGLIVLLFMYSAFHYRVPAGGPDLRAPEDNTTPLALSVFCSSTPIRIFRDTCVSRRLRELPYYTPLAKDFTG